jgi:hypothetical protein
MTSITQIKRSIFSKEMDIDISKSSEADINFYTVLTNLQLFKFKSRNNRYSYSDIFLGKDENNLYIKYNLDGHHVNVDFIYWQKFVRKFDKNHKNYKKDSDWEDGAQHENSRLILQKILEGEYKLTVSKIYHSNVYDFSELDVILARREDFNQLLSRLDIITKNIKSGLPINDFDLIYLVDNYSDKAWLKANLTQEQISRIEQLDKENKL